MMGATTLYPLDPHEQIHQYIHSSSLTTLIINISMYQKYCSKWKIGKVQQLLGTNTQDQLWQQLCYFLYSSFSLAALAWLLFD